MAGLAAATGFGVVVWSTREMTPNKKSRCAKMYDSKEYTARHRGGRGG